MQRLLISHATTPQQPSRVLTISECAAISQPLQDCSPDNTLADALKALLQGGKGEELVCSWRDTPSFASKQSTEHKRPCRHCARQLYRLDEHMQPAAPSLWQRGGVGAAGHQVTGAVRGLVILTCTVPCAPLSSLHVKSA